MKKLNLLVIIIIMLTSACSKKKTITIESLLEEMIDRDAQTRYPEFDFRLKQESSYNRASVNPKDSVGWFANHDFNSNDSDHNFIRIEEKNGQKEWVLMDHHGPGAIVRTWMPFLKPDTPTADMNIKIYLDDSKEPILEGNMLGLLNGDGLFPFPFAHKSLRSAVSFFPIPYRKSCKITTTGRPFFYQITYREYAEGTTVETFTLDDFSAATQFIEEVGKTLLNPERSTNGKKVTWKESLGKNQEKTILLPEGTAAIRALSLKLDNYDTASVTRSVVLKMSFDGKQTVWCPVGDFFGTGMGLNPYQSWHNTVSENGIMNCRWVMPYQETGSITIENLGEKIVEVEVTALVDNYEWNDQSLYFNAAWHGQYPVPTRPFSDWNYVTLKGKGVYVGDALTIMNPVERWWGEGDEKIWVDGEDFPSIFGTGTEDYYAYSWGGISTDFYEHPFHAQPRAHIYNKLNRNTGKEKNTLGYSTELRNRSLDIMPFGTSLQLDMEVWSWTDCDLGYGVGVMWYGSKETVSNRKPDPKGVLVIPDLKKGFTVRD